MAGQGGFYRKGASLHRALQSSFESIASAGHPPSNEHELPTPANQPSSQFLHGSVPQHEYWQPTQPGPSTLTSQDALISQLFSKVDQMMSMISSTNELVRSQQESHSALEKKVTDLSAIVKENLQSSTPASTSKETSRQKIPVELSTAIKKLHESAADKFASDQLYRSEHNEKVSSFLLSQLKEKEFTNPFEDSLMKRAIHRYYESRRRSFNDNQPNRRESVQQNKRRTHKAGFQKRVYTSRAKFLKGDDEGQKWSSIDYRYMTEESDSDQEDLVRQHKLEWRSSELNKLIEKIDKRVEKKAQQKGMKSGHFRKKKRVPSTASSLQPPAGAPAWSVTQEFERVGSEEVIATGGTPCGGTGVGDNARRSIYTTQDVLSNIGSDDFSE